MDSFRRFSQFTSQVVLDEQNGFYLFNWYQPESGQLIDPEVIKRIWYEFQGQPGLTCWIGELLTETYNQAPKQPITMTYFEEVY